MNDLIIPEVIARIARDLASHRTQQPAPAIAEPKQITLSHADVDAILQRKRSATVDELEYAIAHAQEFKLSDWQRNQLGIDASLFAAQRARNANGRREDPGLKFITQVLQMVPTPFGLIERSFIENVLREGSQNIYRCRRHLPPLCRCWASQRAILFQASANGPKTPEGWTADRLYDVLEDLELASKPERQAMPVPEIAPETSYPDARRAASRGLLNQG